MMQNFKILLVEDNPGDVLLMEEMLMESNLFTFEMSNAGTLKEAVEMVSDYSFDIILLDLGLPDSQGLDALNVMLNKTTDIPVLVITGLDDEAKGREAVKLGAQSYISKGMVNERFISDSVAHAVERNKTLQKIRKKDAEVLKKNEQLREVNHALEKLIALLSHDLRGPVKNVVAFLELLLEDFDTLSEDKKKQILVSCIKSGNRTIELMENLLDWARLQIDENKVSPEKVQLDPFINETLEPLWQTASNKRIKIKNLTSANHQFYADRNMISAVIRNLVSNAIKFTPVNGSVIIKSENNIKQLEITIEDSGIGISVTNLDKIFDLSEGFTTPGTDNEKGTGFGLILCKEFVEKNNGTLQIESNEGQGTAVHLILPMKN